jgi:thiamine biosynthesis lipoprotein
MPLFCSSVFDLADEVQRARRSTSVRKKEGFLQGTFLAMGSPCELLLDLPDNSNGQAVVEQVAAEAWRIEDKFSRYLPDNIIHRINNAYGEMVTVDDETADLLDFAARLFALSDGMFDITSGVLREAWQFDGGDQVPAADVVTSILDRVGWKKVRWNRPGLKMPAGMELDFGGIGKEYAVDRAAMRIRALGDFAALVNFGGDLVATGMPGGQHGWQVGIEAPDTADGVAKRIIRLRQGALATSGDARRFILKDGVRYHHILDPHSGWPIRGAARSITVAADTCTEAGMLATLAMLKGPQAELFLRQQGLQYWVFR